MEQKKIRWFVENRCSGATHLTTPQMVAVENLNEDTLLSKATLASLVGGITINNNRNLPKSGHMLSNSFSMHRCWGLAIMAKVI